MFRYGLAIACVVALGEVIARMVGFGTPPLSVTHPTIEYLFAPDQDVQRFGNRVQTNRWSMRSAPVQKTKSDPGEFRILALGDSVLNGGAPTDQSDLATSLLSTGKTRVLNASAGSWGPPNMLAYVAEFGLFDADLMVIVLSSHDAYDVPTFAPLDPATHPTRQPVSALYEAVTRYLPRYLPRLPTASSAKAAPRADALPALNELLALRADRPVCIVLHATRSEMKRGQYESGGDAILKAAKAAGAAVVEDRAFLDPATSFRDDIHLSTAGQRHLAAAIAKCMVPR